MNPKRSSRSRTAFTLIELVCAMSVMAVLSVLVGRIMLDATNQYMAATARSELCIELSTAMERLVGEVRQIRLKNTATPDISSITASSISWGDADGTKSLSLSGTDLVLADAIASAPIARHVTSFGVQAYDDTESALPSVPNTSQLASVRRVQLTITAQRQGVSETLRTRVFLRMLMSGGGM